MADAGDGRAEHLVEDKLQPVIRVQPRAQVRQTAARWQTLVDEAEALSRQGDVSDRIGYLEHQLSELKREDLDPASIATLGSSHRRQAHASARIGACDVAGSCTRTADGSARHRGLELGAGTRLGAWSLQGSASFIHARRRGGVIAPELNGQAPTNVPEWVLRASLGYRFAAVPGLSAVASLSHEGRRNVLPDELGATGAFLASNGAAAVKKPLSAMNTVASAEPSSIRWAGLRRRSSHGVARAPSR